MTVTSRAVHLIQFDLERPPGVPPGPPWSARLGERVSREKERERERPRGSAREREGEKGKEREWSQVSWSSGPLLPLPVLALVT